MKRYKTVKKTISLPTDILKHGLGRSQEESRNFSSYVQSLIVADIRAAIVGQSTKSKSK